MFAQTFPHRDRKRLGALLRQALVEAGVAQQDLAAWLGIPVSVLSKMEKAHRGVDVLDLRAISHALGLSLTEVVERIERTRATDD